MTEEAKQDMVVDEIDSAMDDILNAHEQGTLEDSSSSKQTEDAETETSETSGSDQLKTEQVKEVEGDTSLSPEQKLAKISEILGDDEAAIDAYIKQKGYHTDPAWKKLMAKVNKAKEVEGKSVLSDEDKKLLSDVKEVTSTPEYIRMSMKKQGYTEEAINKTLKEKGFEVEEGDSVDFITSSLGIDKSQLKPHQIQDIKDIADITQVLINRALEKALPEKLNPIQEHLNENAKAESASKITKHIKDTVSGEGVLDYQKDIVPALDKFLDDNPNATQEDVFEHFKKINHSMSVERLKTGKKQIERDDKKRDLRQITQGGETSKLPKKTGNFEEDADAFLDSLGVN